MHNTAPLLTVTNLRVVLNSQPVLSDVSFQVHENETLAVLGPNGAGKTVLLRALLGFLPHQGEITWRKGIQIGYVPQRVELNRELPISVADFLQMKRVNRNDASQILRTVGITSDSILDSQLGTLSSGQFQRVLIAFAMAKAPDILLCDEATAGVDIDGQDMIHEFLHRTQAERSFSTILVTHDLSNLYAEATNVLCLNRQTFCHGSPTEVLDPEVLQRIYGREIRFFRHNHD